MVAVTSARMTSFTLVPQVCRMALTSARWNFSPGEFLRPAVENVESQPLGGDGEFRKQMGELVRGQVPAIRGEALRHARYVRQRRREFRLTNSE